MASPTPMTLDPDTVVPKALNFALFVPGEKSENVQQRQVKQAKEPDGLMTAGPTCQRG